LVLFILLKIYIAAATLINASFQIETIADGGILHFKPFIALKKEVRIHLL